MACCGRASNKTGIEEEERVELNENWMRDLPEYLHNGPVCKLAIPGTHNSGTYRLRPDWKCSPDTEQILKTLSRFPFLVRKILLNYGKCQNLSITVQLRKGIRYFDLRVAFREEDSDYYICHSLYGPKVSEVLEEVKQFLERHETEVVLLDFNHFYMGTERHEGLKDILEHAFNDKLCLRHDHASAGALTLRRLWQEKKQVIVFYNDLQHSASFKFWPSPSSPWANTMNVDLCLEKQLAQANMRDRSSFYVCQGVLTPNTSTVVMHPCSTVRKQCAARINPRLGDWMQHFKDAPGMIYLADFVNTDRFIKHVLSMNTPLGEQQASHTTI